MQEGHNLLIPLPPEPPPLPLCLSLSRIGVSVKQQFTEEEIYKDRDSQIAAIEKTFEDAQKAVRRDLRGGWGRVGVSHPAFGSLDPIPCDSPPPPPKSPQITQHYSKPRVTPIEVMPVFPDFKVGCGVHGVCLGGLGGGVCCGPKHLCFCPCPRCGSIPVPKSFLTRIQRRRTRAVLQHWK